MAFHREERSLEQVTSNNWSGLQDYARIEWNRLIKRIPTYGPHLIFGSPALTKHGKIMGFFVLETATPYVGYHVMPVIILVPVSPLKRIVLYLHFELLVQVQLDKGS